MLLRCENPNYGCWQSFDSQAHLVVCRKHLRLWLIPTTGNTSNILSRLSGMSLVSVLCQCLEESRWEDIHRVTTSIQNYRPISRVAKLQRWQSPEPVQCLISDISGLSALLMKNSFSQVARCGNGMGEKLEKLGAAKMSVDNNIVANVKRLVTLRSIGCSRKAAKACKYFLNILYFCWCFMKHTFISISIFMPYLTSDWWD